MDTTLPDLLIHPKLESLLDSVQSSIAGRFNVLRVKELEIDTDVPVYTVTDKHQERVTITLEPHYYKYLKRESGSRPIYTSYWFDEAQPLYRIVQATPRYIIWTYDDPLTVCGTVIDRLTAVTTESREWTVIEFNRAVRRATEWSHRITHQYSVAVFDLDKTLINREGRIYSHALEMLQQSKRLYDKLVLWSHGSPLHVDTYVARLQEKLGGKNIFDLVLSHRDDYEHEANKNLLHLYNYFPSCCFYRAVLIDDSPYNWTPEYSSLIIPRYSETTKHLLSLL